MECNGTAAYAYGRARTMSGWRASQTWPRVGVAINKCSSCHNTRFESWEKGLFAFLVTAGAAVRAMFCGRRDLLLRIILTGSIGVASILGDKGLKYGQTAMLRAVFDNLTHAAVGGLSWALILNLSRKSLLHNLHSVFLCFSLSSLVDVDHFISARSWKLTDATHLEKRPFLHCTTVPILAWLILILSASVFNYPRLAYYAWIISASFLSHHIRDATRRGFWFCHFGTTQPLPYYVYISLSMALPYILHWFMSLYSSTPKSSDSITTIDIV